MNSLREEVYKYVGEKYKSKIEHLWFKYPNYVVFRNNDNGKWYGIIMDIPYSKLGLKKAGMVDVLNVKVADAVLKDFLIDGVGIFNGYHIAKGNWISIILDGTIKTDNIFKFLDESYFIVNKNRKKY